MTLKGIVNTWSAKLSIIFATQDDVFVGEAPLDDVQSIFANVGSVVHSDLCSSCTALLPVRISWRTTRKVKYMNLKEHLFNNPELNLTDAALHHVMIALLPKAMLVSTTITAAAVEAAAAAV